MVDIDKFAPAIPVQNGVNVICPFITKDGTLAALYDSINGIELTYSRNSVTFKQSPVIIIKGAVSPLCIGEDLVAFIINDEIGIKIYIDMDIYAAMNVGDMSTSEGNYQTNLEQVQGHLDNTETILIGSGKVTAQKLSGYKTTSGVYKIFFYGANGALTSMQSTNMRTWGFTPNF